MSFKLLNTNYTNGLEAQAILALSTLKQFATLTPPVLEADMRTEVDAGQAPNAISDAGWTVLVNELGALPLDEPALTPAEASIVNTIREIATPLPQEQCCGLATPVDGLFSIAAVQRVGSVTFEHAITVTLDASVDCDVKKVSLTLTPFGGAPAVTVSQPAAILFKCCSLSGDSEWQYLWYTFATDPTGTQYDVFVEFFDGDGVSMTSFTSATKLTMP